MRLRDALELVPDHRSSQGRRHSLGAILGLAVCAMLCGARSLYAIAQWGRDHGAPTAELLGFSHGRTPCVATLHRVFKDLDVSAFEAVLAEWLVNTGAKPDDPLSLDGKTMRGIHGEEIPGVHLVFTWCSPGVGLCQWIWGGVDPGGGAGQRPGVGGGQRGAALGSLGGPGSGGGRPADTAGGK